MGAESMTSPDQMLTDSTPSIAVKVSTAQQSATVRSAPVSAAYSAGT